MLVLEGFDGLLGLPGELLRHVNHLLMDGAEHLGLRLEGGPGGLQSARDIAGALLPAGDEVVRRLQVLEDLHGLLENPRRERLVLRTAGDQCLLLGETRADVLDGSMQLLIARLCQLQAGRNLIGRIRVNVQLGLHFADRSLCEHDDTLMGGLLLGAPLGLVVLEVPSSAQVREHALDLGPLRYWRCIHRGLILLSQHTSLGAL
mmetsp:Transcript_97056/g.257886  ORF Transcript_97056/g.257886 Transcript_97056/m.257886 type:complete len:204 (-) Transcript_97056:968-1579(-)